MIFIYTNIISGLTILILFFVSLFMEGFKFKVKTLQLTIISVICALSVILTNLLGYNIAIFGLNIRLALGQWLMFVVGLYFGPILGILSSIATDTIGDLINIGGGFYHLGFLLNIVLIGFSGSLIKYMGTKKFVLIKVVLIYSLIYFIQSFVLNPIWIYSMGLSELIYVDITIRLVKLPISLFIYNSLLIVTIPFFKKILLDDYEFLWTNKKND